MADDARRTQFQSAASISFDDEDVYEDDSDFEYLNIPSYALNDDRGRTPRVNEGSSLIDW